MNEDPLLKRLEEKVLELTLNRPERRNAFNDALYEEVRAALAGAREDDGVHAVIITGAPGAFGAGQDLSEMGRTRAFTPFVDELARFDKPLLAAVNGVAVGIGLTMLLHCDVVYVAENARLRAPFAGLGLVPEAGSTALLPRLIGTARAAELLLSARWIEAREAVEIGLAARVLAEDKLLPETRALAAQMAAQPLAALGETKRLILAERADALAAARHREDDVQSHRIGSPENRAAIEAFRRRRG